MKKLIAISLFCLISVAAFAQDQLRAQVIIPLGTITSGTTNTSTNFSAGFAYTGTNTTPINAAFPAFGNTLFVANSIVVSSNVIQLRLQDSSDNTNYTTRLTWTSSSTSPTITNYNVGTLLKFWRVQAVSTNANASTGTVTVNALYKPIIQ